MSTIRILIADDHTIVRMGLVSLLKMKPDLEVVGQAKNGREAIALAAKLKPDVIVMDLMMPVIDGSAATAEICAARPETGIVILTTYATSDGIAQALKNGARGAVFKSTADTDLIPAIRKVASGQMFLSSDIRQLLDNDPPVEPLSARQYEIMEFIVRGLSNAEIAHQLGISATVVREHTTTLFQKLGAANRTEAVGIALRKHLLKI